MEIEPSTASLQRVPTTMKAIGEKHLSTFLKLIDAIEDDDDVQNVYHNADVSEELLEQYL